MIYNVFGAIAILMGSYYLHEVTFNDAAPLRWVLEWITIFILCATGLILNMIAI